MARTIFVNPAVQNYYVEVAPPSLEDPVTDWERLAGELASRFGLEGLQIDYQALRGLQQVMRAGQWCVTATVWMGREVMGVRPGLGPHGTYGLAVDIGTTTIAGYLCDLETGDVLASSSSMNPQLAYGEDVMSRISYAAANNDGLARLHGAITQALNELARDVTAQAGLVPQDIAEAVLVGNTVMHHLALNLDPACLGRAPFLPALHHSLNVKARELGLAFHPGANMHVLPIEAGFVGADNVGVLLAEEPYNRDEQWLIIDIGTNGEIVLGNRDRLLCASCACGPALEGGHIRSGMRAAPGAIERVRIDPQTWETSYQVIGRSGWSTELPAEEIQAQGICGSGVIEAVAEMLAAGIIGRNGRMNAKASHPRLRRREAGLEYVLAWGPETTSGKEISLTQHDVRAVALAKAAIYSGCKLLLKRLGLERPDRIILAGAFGSLIDHQRAIAMGLFPRIEPEKVYCAGNAAGDGARIALINVDKRAEADRIARQVEHIELMLDRDFEEEYAYALYFPHMRDR